MKAVVMGLGASGRAAAGLMQADTAIDEVVGVDLRPALDPIEGVRLELGTHRLETFLSADLIVVSPGIPLTQADLTAARDQGVEILGEVGYADRFLQGLPRVGITGTNGKSTVTHFTGVLLAAAGRNPFVGGNLGNSLSNAVGAGHDCLVVELSSYQLESAGNFRADVGVLLNLTPDHLGRHGTMDGYAAAKAKLFDHATDDDLALVPEHDERIRRAVAHHRGSLGFLGTTPGVSRVGTAVRVALPGLDPVDFDLGSLQVPGEHNRDNAATALACAVALGADAEALQDAIGTLTALPHRMQIVPSDDGRVWIDDSKSTNVDSTLAALRGRTEPTVLLLGGQWKGEGYDALADHLDAVRHVICFGRNGPDIAAALGSAEVQTVTGLADAVRLAHSLSHAGDHVLLSPACASFDEFDDFEHRGKVFASLVTQGAT